MQKISVGDVYYLKPVLNSTVSPEHAKQIAYLLGTVSERPCVVIRAPIAWDPYGEVEVLPGLSSAKPTLTFHMHDIYGYLGCDYPFAPHSAHTVSIARLGRYIGHLTMPELKELLYAYHWIHDPFMQMDTEKFPIPECYKEAYEKLPELESHPEEPKHHYEAITVDKDLTIVNGPCKGAKLDINLQNATNPHFAEQVVERGVVPTPVAPAPEEAAHTEEPQEADTEGTVITFPVSVFSLDNLKKYAGKFKYPPIYYSNRVKVKDDLSILTNEEKDKIIANVSDDVYRNVTKIYKTLKPVDRDILAVRLPTSHLAKLLHINMMTAACLKRLCNVMFAITDDDYDSRLAKKDDVNQYEQELRHIVEEKFKLRYPTYMDYNIIRRELNNLRPYLNKNGIMNIPKNLMASFICIPTSAVRKAFTGKLHQMVYADAYHRCKMNLLKEIENEERERIATAV